MSSEAIVEEGISNQGSTRDSGFNDADENDNTTGQGPGKSEQITKQTVISSVQVDEMETIEERKVEKLEIPSEELRCIQKQVLIEKMMTGSPKKISPRKMVEETDESMEIQEESEDSKRHNDSEDNQPKRHRGRSNHKKNANLKSPAEMPMPPPRKTFKMKSSVLDRVKSFLPEFKTANDSLIRLPDASKLSLESDSDRDEMDGTVTVELSAPEGEPQAGPSSNHLKTQKPYVEMNLALYADSGSDTSSDDDDDSILHGKVKGLPIISKKKGDNEKSPEELIIDATQTNETESTLSMTKTDADANKKVFESDQEQATDADKTEP